MVEKLLGMSPAQLKAVAVELGLKTYAAQQIAEWIYKKCVGSIEDMTNLSLGSRKALSDKYTIGNAAPVKAQHSSDGTIKYLYAAGNNNYIESVYIPDKERATLCVSTQIGCRMGCTFCMTGRQGFGGQLSAADILNQIYSLPERDTLTNIVFMGMGEPLDNINAVMASLDVLTAQWGFAWSPRRITVSTIGIKNSLQRFIDDSRCHLAISLHHPLPEGRAALMLAERQWAISNIVDMLHNYDWTGGRRLSFEYICFKGINDTPAHINRLVTLLHGLPCRINLIRFHSIPNSPLQGTSDERMLQIRDYLTANNLYCTIRASRGEDILAACGMLSTSEIALSLQPNKE